MIYDEATPFRSEYNAGADIVMSTSPLLSIITPMYNAGSMFDEFMQSLLAQTLTLLEIIIVDDGSTDGSGERADQYAQQHSYIRVIHQENGGVSHARNAGLAIARGKYVTFPDADDTMQPDMYQTLVTLAEADNLDAAQCNAEWFFKHSQRVKPLIPLDRLRSFAGTERCRLAEYRTENPSLYACGLAGHLSPGTD